MASSRRGRSAGSCEKSASICDDPLRAGVESAARSRRDRPGRSPACAGRCRTSTSPSSSASRSAIRPVPSGDASSTTSSRRLGGQRFEHRAHERLDRLGLVEGRNDDPYGFGGGQGGNNLDPRGHEGDACATPRSPPRSTSSATLYELDGAVRYRVIAYREAARVIRDSPVSVAELARAGRATELPGIGKTLQEKIVTLLDEGSIPSADKLKQKFPAVADRGDRRSRGSGPRRRRGSTTSSASRRWRELKAGGRGGQTCAASRGWGRRRRRTSSPRPASSRRRAPPSAGCSPRCCRSPRSWRRRCARSPARRRSRSPGSARRWAETCKDIDLIATARRSRGAGRGPRRAPARGRCRARRGTPAPGSSPTTGSRSTCGWPQPDGLRQPAAALHRLGGAQRRAARARASRAGCRSPSTGSPTSRRGKVTLCATEQEVYEALGLAYIEPELREGAGELRAAADGRAARAGPRSTTCAATCTATRRCRTAATRSRRWRRAARDRGYAYLAVTDHSASHGFGNHVTAEAAREADRGGARARRRAAPLPPARRLGGQHRDRRLARLPRRAARRARLGDRQRPHLVPDRASAR